MCCNRDIIIEPIMVHNRGDSLQQTNCMKIHPHNLIRRSNLLVARKLLRHEPWWVDDGIPDFSPWFYATTNFSKNQDVLITVILLFKPHHELSFNAPNGMENQHVLVLTGISWNPPNRAESCNATNLDMICCITALAHPKSWLRNMMGWEKKTARIYFLSEEKWRVPNHRN